jgi:hypothetical protein
MRWLRSTGTTIVTITTTMAMAIILRLALALSFTRPNVIVAVSLSPVLQRCETFLQPVGVHKRRVGLYGRPPCVLPRSVVLTLTGNLFVSVEVPEIRDDDLFLTVVVVKLRGGSETDMFVVRHGAYRYPSWSL